MPETATTPPKKVKASKSKSAPTAPVFKAPVFQSNFTNLGFLRVIFRKIRVPVFLVLLFLMVTLALMSLPQAVQLAQSQVLSQNLPNNKVVAADQPQVAGIVNKIIIPQSKGLPAPVISASAAIIQDLSSGTILFVKDPEKRVPIASTTKIMTAMVASEYYQIDSVLTVKDTSGFEGSSMGLKVGESMTFKNLLFGLMLNSGNDAAYTMATNYPGEVEGFVEAMNTKARMLGLLNTHFDNPAGYDSKYHFSSAQDLVKISAMAIKNETLSRIVQTKDAEVASVDQTTIHGLKNLNKLLGTDGVLGIKTGTTPEAKENFVGLIEQGDKKILTVVLGSNDRFGETKSLIDWTFQNFVWER